jgi:hypothetical protein
MTNKNATACRSFYARVTDSLARLRCAPPSVTLARVCPLTAPLLRVKGPASSLFLAVLLCASILIAPLLAGAQYNPIPNFTGNLAGQQFRNAINGKLNGSDPIAPQLVHIFFFQLPAIVTNGQMFYVIDGVSGSNPCAQGGGGAVAQGIAGAWVCGTGGGGGSNPINSAPAQTAKYNARGFGFGTVACPGTSADALVEGCDIGDFAPIKGTFTAVAKPATANACYVGGTDSGGNDERNYTLCGNGVNIATTLSFGSSSGPNLTHTYNLAQPASGVINTWTFAAGGGAALVCPSGTCPDSIADYPANACTANSCVDRVTVQYIASSNTYFLTVDGR